MIRKGCFALLCAITLTNCLNQFSDLQQMNKFDEIPVGITEDLHLIYSDSLENRPNFLLINIDFTNQNFPYSNFTEELMQLYMAIEVKSHLFALITVFIIQKQESLI